MLGETSKTLINKEGGTPNLKNLIKLNSFLKKYPKKFFLLKYIPYICIMDINKTNTLDFLNSKDKEMIKLGIVMYFKLNNLERKQINYIFKYAWRKLYETPATIGNLEKEGYKIII